jgi:hypothetical protein
VTQPDYFTLPPAETGINVPRQSAAPALALAAVFGWLAHHAGPLSLVLGHDSITLSAAASDAPKRRGPKPSENPEETFEGRRNRSGKFPRLRFERALRESVRLNAPVVTLPNGDVGFAAHVDVVRAKMRELRAEDGLSGHGRAATTELLRGRDAALAAGSAEQIEHDGELYLRPSWAPTNSSKVSN